jgi:hypothetical protein
MMRLSLSDLALRIKIMKVKLGTSIEDVLSRALDPPVSINVQRAIAMLVEVRFSQNSCRLGSCSLGWCFDNVRRNHSYGPLAQQASH